MERPLALGRSAPPPPFCLYYEQKKPGTLVPVFYTINTAVLLAVNNMLNILRWLRVFALITHNIIMSTCPISYDIRRDYQVLLL